MRRGQARGGRARKGGCCQGVDDEGGSAEEQPSKNRRCEGRPCEGSAVATVPAKKSPVEGGAGEEGRSGEEDVCFGEEGCKTAQEGCGCEERSRCQEGRGEEDTGKRPRRRLHPQRRPCGEEGCRCEEGGSVEGAAPAKTRQAPLVSEQRLKLCRQIQGQTLRRLWDCSVEDRISGAEVHRWLLRYCRVRCA